MKTLNPLWLCLIFFFLSLSSQANNLQIQNVSIGNQNTTQDFSLVSFDVSWENSWRTSTLESNHDAAWLFVKYRIVGFKDWHHASLNASDANHTTPAGAELDVAANAKGGYLYRNSTGNGNVNYTGVQLRWEYGADGLNDFDSVEVCVMGIEMVYIPQDTFFLGDGSGNFEGNFEDSVSGNPFVINSEAALTLGGGSEGSLGNNNASGMNSIGDDFNDGTTQSLPAAFPKGYDAFYAMKYEITQEQYVEFLNRLDRSQQQNRVDNTSGNRYVANNGLAPPDRHGIRVVNDPGAPERYTFACELNDNGVGGENDDGQNVACSNISIDDAMAYADWVGLRMLTELEYEKMARGPIAPFSNEPAWRSINYIPASGLANAGDSTEIPSNASANIAAQDILGGPIRVGAFADAGGSGETRESSGGSYYGLMELSGNLWEIYISVGQATNRSYQPNSGDGELSTAGEADVPNWPVGVGAHSLRGGSYRNDPPPSNYSLAVSNRRLGVWTTTGRNPSVGVRLGGNAP